MKDKEAREEIKILKAKVKKLTDEIDTRLLAMGKQIAKISERE